LKTKDKSVQQRSKSSPRRCTGQHRVSKRVAVWWPACVPSSKSTLRKADSELQKTCAQPLCTVFSL
jgi:hypothetical protein